MVANPGEQGSVLRVEPLRAESKKPVDKSKKWNREVFNTNTEAFRQVTMTVLVNEYMAMRMLINKGQLSKNQLKGWQQQFMTAFEQFCEAGADDPKALDNIITQSGDPLQNNQAVQELFSKAVIRNGRMMENLSAYAYMINKRQKMALEISMGIKANGKIGENKDATDMTGGGLLEQTNKYGLHWKTVFHRDAINLTGLDPVQQEYLRNIPGMKDFFDQSGEPLATHAIPLLQNTVGNALNHELARDTVEKQFNSLLAMQLIWEGERGVIENRVITGVLEKDKRNLTHAWYYELNETGRFNQSRSPTRLFRRFKRMGGAAVHGVMSGEVLLGGPELRDIDVTLEKFTEKFLQESQRSIDRARLGRTRTEITAKQSQLEIQLRDFDANEKVQIEAQKAKFNEDLGKLESHKQTLEAIKNSQKDRNNKRAELQALQKRKTDLYGGEKAKLENGVKNLEAQVAAQQVAVDKATQNLADVAVQTKPKPSDTQINALTSIKNQAEATLKELQEKLGQAKKTDQEAQEFIDNFIKSEAHLNAEIAKLDTNIMNRINDLGTALSLTFAATDETGKISEIESYFISNEARLNVSLQATEASLNSLSQQNSVEKRVLEAKIEAYKVLQKLISTTVDNQNHVGIHYARQRMEMHHIDTGLQYSMQEAQRLYKMSEWYAYMAWCLWGDTVLADSDAGNKARTEAKLLLTDQVLFDWVMNIPLEDAAGNSYWYSASLRTQLHTPPLPQSLNDTRFQNTAVSRAIMSYIRQDGGPLFSFLNNKLVIPARDGTLEVNPSADLLKTMEGIIPIAQKPYNEYAVNRPIVASGESANIPGYRSANVQSSLSAENKLRAVELHRRLNLQQQSETQMRDEFVRQLGLTDAEALKLAQDMQAEYATATPEQNKHIYMDATVQYILGAPERAKKWNYAAVLVLAGMIQELPPQQAEQIYNLVTKQNSTDVNNIIDIVVPNNSDRYKSMVLGARDVVRSSGVNFVDAARRYVSNEMLRVDSRVFAHVALQLDKDRRMRAAIETYSNKYQNIHDVNKLAVEIAKHLATREQPSGNRLNEEARLVRAKTYAVQVIEWRQHQGIARQAA